jgi:DNA-binding CsgD family transcriptional regulator
LEVEQDRKVLTDRCASLSPREREVLQGLSMRRRAKEIARDLNISEHTVRGYANDARQKLGVTSVRDAALIYLEYARDHAPPQNQGDRFQRVSGHQFDSASLDPGFSNALQDGLNRTKGNISVAEGKTTAFAIGAQSGWLGKLHAWLAALSLARWLAMIVLLTLGVILAFGAAATALWGIFEVLHQIGSQSR